MSNITRLIFVYNANSGLASAIVDSARKFFNLNPCSLCTITHGLLKEKKSWTECQINLNLPISYYHKDDLPSELKPIVNNLLPCIIAEEEKKFTVLLNAEEINSCKGDVEKLNSELKKKL